MPDHVYIAVEGPIGVGKTTLARLLAQEFSAHLILEGVEENPFLESFYRDQERYGLETQMFFLLSRWRQQRDIVEQALLQHISVVCDYLLAKDRIFGQLTLKPDERDVHARVYALLEESLPRPDLVIYLQAEGQALVDRVAQRDRPFERAMPSDYLEAVRRAYEIFFATYRDTRLLAVDTNHLDFAGDEEALAEVLSRVRSALRKGVYQPALLDL